MQSIRKVLAWGQSGESKPDQEPTMHERDLSQGIHSRKADQTGAVGLMVLVVVLIFMVCTAASLLLTLPQSFDSTANAAPRVTDVAANRADVPFHEQYRMDAAGEPVNPPTF